MLPLELKRQLLRYSKLNAPVETGNLRDNAIKGFHFTNPNKFTINYSIADAYYLEYLENKTFAGGSSTKQNRHKGFIFKTYLGIAGMLDGYFNKGKNVSGFKKINNDFNLMKTLRHINSLEMNSIVKQGEREYIYKDINVK